jgi:phenylacetate-CoA ligase
MRRIDKITGRSDDMMIIRGVNVFPTQIEEQILKIKALAPHYEIVVEKDGNLDKVMVKVELTPDAQNIDQAPVVKELQHHIKSVVGISTKIEVVPVGGLPRSEGKAKRVFDNRPKG